MSAFSGGGHGKGALRAHRQIKRDEAAARDQALAASSPSRRQNRLQIQVTVDRLELVDRLATKLGVTL